MSVMFEMPGGTVIAASLQAVQELLRRQEGEEFPGIRPVQKMDARGELWAGICTCGWASDGIESEARAWKSARQHIYDFHR